MAEGYLKAGGATGGGDSGPVDELVQDLTDQRVPKFDSAQQKFVDSSMVETQTELIMDKRMRVPAGSVQFGDSLELSEGTADLVIVDLVKKEMAFPITSHFSHVDGADVPTYFDFGPQFVLPVNPDDSNIITTNPLAFSITGTVVAPAVRLVDTLTLRANGPMINFTAKVVDNVTGIPLRYIPNRAAYEGRLPGLDLIAGDNIFAFTSKDPSTPGVFNLGYIPFILESGQFIDLVFAADNMDLLGAPSEFPYIEVTAHDGAHKEVGGGGTLNYSETSMYSLGETVTIFGIPFVNIIPVTVPEVFVPSKWTCLNRNLKTGVLSGGLITITGAGLTFDIAAMTGIIVDNSDLNNYLVTPIDFPTTADIPNENLATGTSQILINALGNVIQLAIRTIDDELNNISLGRTSNSGGIAVNPVQEHKTAYSIPKTTQALLASIGGQSIVSTIFEPGATGLTVNTPNDSKILSQGRNFPTDSDNPDIADVLGESPVTAAHFFRTFITDNNGTFNIGALVNEVDNSQYNPLGDTLVAVPAGKFQVQRVYTFGGSSIHVFYYGRTLYDTKQEALQAFDSSDEFTEHGVTSPGAFSAFVIIQEGITDWSDPDTFEIINRTGGIVGSFDRGIPKGGIGGLSAEQKQSVLASKSTGLFSGGGLSGVATETVFDIAAGTGQVIDNSVPGITTEDPYSWSTFADIALTELATAKHTFIFLKKTAGVVGVVQIGDDSTITEIDRKTMLYLGVIRHGDGTFVGAISQPQTIVSPSNKHIDGYIADGKCRAASGNRIVATGAGLLTLDKEIGKSYGIGINAFNDGNNTDFKTNPALAAVTMLKYSSAGHINGDTITNVDTSRYDPNGATIDAELVALVGGGTHVAHRVWIEAVTNTLIFQYGQASYANEDDAIAQWNQEDLTLPSGLNESSYLKSILIVQNGAANLDTATFIPVSGGAGSSGSVAPTPIVDNLLSTDPNSALSANQGRLLNNEDLANADLAGANIRLIKKGGAVVTIVDGAANIANKSLTFNGARTVNFDDNIWLLANVPTGNTMLVFDPTTQSLLGFAGSNFKATAEGLDLQIAPGVGDLRINGVSGEIGQVITSKGVGSTPTWENPNTASASMQVTTFVYDDAAAAQDELRVHGANLDGAALAVDVGTLGSPVISSENKLVTTDFTPDGGQTEVTLTITKGTEEIKVFTTLAALIGFQVTDATEDSTANEITIYGNGLTVGTTVSANEGGSTGIISVAPDGRSLVMNYTRLAEPGNFVQLTVTESAVSIDVIAQLEAQDSVDYGIANAIVHKFPGAAADQWVLRVSGINFVGGLENAVTVIDGDQDIGGANGSVTLPIPIVYPGDPIIRELLMTYTAPAGQTWAGFEIEAAGKRQHFAVNIPAASGIIAATSYISINATGAGTHDGVNPILSAAGFGDNYNVMPLVDADLERTNDPSGMIDGNTLDIKVAGVYEIHWSYFETVGAFSYGYIRINGTIIASGEAGRDLNGQVSTTSTIVTLIIGDKVEFATTMAVTTDGLRKPSVFLNQIR